MKKALILLITILTSDLVFAQNLMFLQRPTYRLTEYQNLYAGNFIKETQAYQLNGNVKSVTTTLLERKCDPLTYKTSRLNEIINYFEIYEFNFSTNQKLRMYKVQSGQEYCESTGYNPKIDTITTIKNYIFDDENNKLLKIVEYSYDSHGFHGKSTTEKDFDSLGFLKQENSFRVQASSGKEMFYLKTYKWNKQRNVMNYQFNYYSDKEEQGKSSFKSENYEKAFYTDTVLSINTGNNFLEGNMSTFFDKRGNIILETSYEPDIRSMLPNNYTFTYKYNDSNELLEISKSGSEPTRLFNNEKTVFLYSNYDQFGNWQEMTIKTTDDNKKYTILKYKREILYY